jgi:ParB family chromosome partitioning protein
MNLLSIDSFLGKEKEKEENAVVQIPVIQIRPNRTQPRKYFNEEELRNLSASIVENGIIQPLTVRKISTLEYELIAGERRLRASILAGMKKVPCIIIRCSDKESAVLALLENLQRSDLGVFEEARGIARLIKKYSITQEQAAQRLGKKQSTIANKLRLLRLSLEEQDWITESGLTERHARALLKIDDESLRRECLSKIVTDNLNVKQSEDMIDAALQNAQLQEAPKQGRKVVIRDVRIFVNTINKAVDTMRLSGIKAVAKKKETEEYIEYTVKIPKNEAVKTPEKAKQAS